MKAEERRRPIWRLHVYGEAFLLAHLSLGVDPPFLLGPSVLPSLADVWILEIRAPGDSPPQRRGHGEGHHGRRDNGSQRYPRPKAQSLWLRDLMWEMGSMVPVSSQGPQKMEEGGKRVRPVW